MSTSDRRILIRPEAAFEMNAAYIKIAISLPDAVFHAADRQAKRSGKSRSQLYADALTEYLSRHGPDEVTTAMDQVVDPSTRRVLALS